MEDSQLPKIESVFSNSSIINTSIREPKPTYHYEIDKITTHRNALDFDFFSSLLMKKCNNNELVLNELNHMKSNINNEIEYYASLMLIRAELSCE
jgi:hypothetical protein